VARHAIALVAVSFLTFFAGLGQSAITDSDEAFYAESAREMVATGDWLTPRFNETDRFEKPVLYYWLAASAYVVFGVNEMAARLPSALAGLGLALLTFAMARRWLDPATALTAGLITATSFGYVSMARQALPDLPLAFFVSLTTWGLIRAWLDDPAGTPSTDAATRKHWLLVAATAGACGFLMKGPVAIALPGIVVIPMLGWEAWWGRSRAHLRAGDIAFAGTVFALLAAPWFIAMANEHGLAYLQRFFIGENVERFATERYNAARPFWYYGPIVAGGLLPWSPYMVLWWPGIVDMIRTRRAPSLITLRLIVWAVAPLVFYSLSVGKQPRYILPVLPPLAVLLAVAIQTHVRSDDRRRWLFTAATATAGGLLVVIGGLAYRLRPLLVDWSSPAVPTAAAVAIGLSGLGVLVTLRRPDRTPWTVSVAGVIVTLAAYLVILTSPGPDPVERMARMVNQAQRNGESYGRHRVFNRNLVFYTRQAHVELPILQAAGDFLRSPEPVLGVLLAADVARLEAQGVRLTLLGEVVYLNTGDLKPRTLIDPDPATHLERVLLVANR
jgi:4-amino-4-deoxy-L-arabinose transferase-like glycosyltransferase